MRNPYQPRRAKNNTANLDTSLERYRFFVKNIVAMKQVWGLYYEGWAIGATSQGRNALVLWSDKSYAKLCQTHTWEKYEPTAISLEKFIHKMLPYALDEKILLSIMMTPDGQSVFLEPEKVLLDIKEFLSEVHLKAPEFFEKNPDVPLPNDIRLNTV